MGSLLGVKNKKSEDYSKADFLKIFNSHIKWKKHKTVNTYRYFLHFREVCPMQIIDWIQACWGTRNDHNVTSNKNKMADLPDPCAQPLSSYILVTSFYSPCRHNNNAAESEARRQICQVLKKWSPWLPVYVRVSLLPFIPHKKYSSICGKLEPRQAL